MAGTLVVNNYRRIAFLIAALSQYPHSSVTDNQLGLLEELISKPRQTKQRFEVEMPEAITKLPGFKEIPKYDGNNVHASEMVSWAKTINHHFIDDVLIPAGEHHRAAQQMIKLGKQDKAVIYASETMEPEQLADICELAQTGFGIGIKAAIEHEMPGLEERLKKSHIQAVKEGVFSSNFNRSKKWESAIHLAECYWPEGEEAGSILEEGIESLFKEFYGEVNEWRRKLNFYDSWNYRGSERSREDFNKEERTKTERKRYVKSPATVVKALIDLVKTLPEKRVEEEKTGKSN